MIIVGDLHAKYEEPFRSSINSFLEWLLSNYKDYTLIFLGDLYDSSSPHNDVRDEVASCIKQFKEVHIFDGNHDYYRIKGSAIKPLRQHDNIHIYNKVTEVKIEGHSCLMLPFKYSGMKEEYEALEGTYDYIFTHITPKECAIGDEGIDLKLNGVYIHGHCFSEDTEILVKDKGWVKGINLKEKDIVATMNKNTELLEWQKINKYFEYNNYNELYHIKARTIDLLVTDKHGIIYKNQKGNLIETTADNFKYKGNKIFNALNKTEGIQEDYNKLKILTQIVADSHLEKYCIRWHLRKKRKIDRLCKLLNDLSYNFSCIKQKTGNYKINLSAKDSKEWIKILNNNKQLPYWVSKLNKNCADIILEEYKNTDGSQISKNSIQIGSSKEIEIDILQELFVTNGYRATKTKKKNKEFFILTVCTKYNNTTLSNNSVYKKIPYKGKVWCVNVNNGTLLIRRNGKTAITLNTHTPTEFISHNNNHYVIGVPLPTRYGEHEHEHVIYEITDHIEKIKVPNYFTYEDIEYGEMPNNKNNIYNIKNAPSHQLVKSTYKDYYIRDEGIEYIENEEELKDVVIDENSLIDECNVYAKEEQIPTETLNICNEYFDKFL